MNAESYKNMCGFFIIYLINAIHKIKYIVGFKIDVIWLQEFRKVILRF